MYIGNFDMIQYSKDSKEPSLYPVLTTVSPQKSRKVHLEMDMIAKRVKADCGQEGMFLRRSKGLVVKKLHGVCR